MGPNKIEVSGYSNGKIYKDALTVNLRCSPTNWMIKKHLLNRLIFYWVPNRYLLTKPCNSYGYPDQPYHAGSWGHIGGKPFVIGKNSSLPYGTDKNIAGTNNDPVYQTQQTGIQQYRFDVPAGNYELTLYLLNYKEG